MSNTHIHNQLIIGIEFYFILFYTIPSQFTREPDGDFPDIDSDSFPPMPDILFTTPGIEKLLNNLNPTKAS